MSTANFLTAILLIQRFSSGKSLAGLSIKASNFETFQHEPSTSLATSANKTGIQTTMLGAYAGNATRTAPWFANDTDTLRRTLANKNHPLVNLEGQLRETNSSPWYFGYFNPWLSNGNTNISIFPLHENAAVPRVNPIRDFFNSGSTSDWITLAVEILVCILLDVLVLQRFPHTRRFNMWAVGMWIVVAILCDGAIFCRYGSHNTREWTTGYILEWVLSFENIFVFQLVFKSFHTPASSMHKAVFVGIIGALILRMFFFLTISSLLDVFHWIRWPFGLLLVWSGYQVTLDEDDEADIKDTMLFKVMTCCFGSRLRSGYDGNNCFSWDSSGRLQITYLALVICTIEITDLIFALDSVSAKVANLPNLYIAFSSSVIAMFGLRSMFFIIQDLSEMFALMKYGLALILVFVGFQLVLMDSIHIQSYTVSILIVSTLFISIVASRLKQSFGTLAAPPAETSLDVHNNPSKPKSMA